MEEEEGAALQEEEEAARTTHAPAAQPAAQSWAWACLQQQLACCLPSALLQLPLQWRRRPSSLCAPAPVGAAALALPGALLLMLLLLQRAAVAQGGAAAVEQEEEQAPMRLGTSLGAAAPAQQL